MSTAKRHKERDGEVGEGSLAYLVTKPVDLAVLDAEMASAHNWRRYSGLVVEGDPTKASEEAPVVLWVLRADAEANTVRKVLTAHQGVEADVSAEGLDSLRTLVAERDLTADELQTAVRLLLTKGS